VFSERLADVNVRVVHQRVDPAKSGDAFGNDASEKLLSRAGSSNLLKTECLSSLFYPDPRGSSNTASSGKNSPSLYSSSALTFARGQSKAMFAASCRVC
jgi:hypothetical protein